MNTTEHIGTGDVPKITQPFVTFQISFSNSKQLTIFRQRCKQYHRAVKNP